MRKLALKKLKASDLSFFKSYLAKHPTAKQKAFNLDLNIMEGKFFPSLRTSLAPLKKQAAHVDLTLWGPAMADAHTLARKVKRDAKNIRLNGEIVDAPVTHPDRYDILTPGDFAIMEFIGTALPEVVNVILVTAGHPADARLHSALLTLLPSANNSMKIISEDSLAEIIDTAAPPAEHPVRAWLDTAMLENIAQGSTEAVESLNKRQSGRGMSPSDFKTSKETAEHTGFLGEEHLDHFFRQAHSPDIATHEWVAQSNAISPFDFRLTMKDGTEHHADAKSTSGKFDNPVFLSIAEIRHAVQSGFPYDIYRLYNVRESSAEMKIARDIGRQLAPVLEALEKLPAGVNVDTMSFAPAFFAFLPENHTLEPSLTEEDETTE